MFSDILEERNAFLDYKNKKFKNHGLIKNFFWGGGGGIGAEKCVYDILEGKNAFLNYENKNFKEAINWNFYQGVSLWFWSKIDNFSRLLF